MKVICKLVDEDGVLVQDISKWVHAAPLPNIGEGVYFNEYFENEEKADTLWTVYNISHEYGRDNFGEATYTMTAYIKPKD